METQTEKSRATLKRELGWKSGKAAHEDEQLREAGRHLCPCPCSVPDVIQSFIA